MNNDIAKKLNIRQKQAYAAVCVWYFCKYFNISHKHIDDFILHLMEILIAQDLSEWELEGSKLYITARGDELPGDIADIIPVQILIPFKEIIEYSVEVGIIDMYGAPTVQPNLYLNKCIQILKINKILLPPVDVLESTHPEEDGWGNEISSDEFIDVLKSYSMLKIYNNN
jgi:hypothetical protein